MILVTKVFSSEKAGASGVLSGKFYMFHETAHKPP
jgi:hypothetical protein